MRGIFSGRPCQSSMLCLFVLSALLTSSLGENYLAADGCSWNDYSGSGNGDATDILTGAVFAPKDGPGGLQNPLWTDESTVLAISCCSDTGACSRDGTVPADSDGSGRFGNFSSAEAYCSSEGKRLCFLGEVDGCCQTGYNFDFQRVWTAHPGVPEQVVLTVSTGQQRQVADGCPTSQAEDSADLGAGFTLPDFLPVEAAEAAPKDLDFGPSAPEEIPSSNVVPISCCDQGGNSCARTGFWGSWEQAVALCESSGARLCSIFEVHQCCGTGAQSNLLNWDFQQTWTSGESFPAPVYTGPRYQTVDGCARDSAKSTSPHDMMSLRENVPVAPLDLDSDALAQEWRFESEIFAVQCCSSDGDSCLRQAEWGTWDQASQLCNSLGRRLCAAHEADRCCDGGYRLDYQRVWSIEREFPENSMLSVDGCDENNGKTNAVRGGVPVPSADKGNPMQPSWEDVNSVLAVHCCGGPPETFCTRENTTIEDPEEGLWGTWAEAKAQCENLGRRLCNATEATKKCCKTGHNFDFQRVWTSEAPPPIPLVDDPNSCSASDKATCGDYASCSKADGNVTCTCWPGFVETENECEDVDECKDEAKSLLCDRLAYCVNTPGSFMCVCPEGFLGTGFNCSSDSWAVRMVFQCEDASNLHQLNMQLYYAQGVMRASLNETDDIVETAKVEVYNYPDQITANALFYTEAEALAQVEAIKNDDTLTWDDLALGGCVVTEVVDGPQVYRFVGQSTSDPIDVRPSGMEVDRVYFEPVCLNSGCWVVDLTYTIGTDDFNAFFIPRANASDELSYDPDYSTVNANWGQSPLDTFLPNTNPCTTADLDTSLELRAQATACCLKQFFDMYRPIASFEDAAELPPLDTCTTGARDRWVNKSLVPELSVGSLPGDAGAPAGVYVKGNFSGMASYGMTAGVVDPFVGIYKARFYLDEVELRTMAGMLRGTVGVEHTVDTFIGILNLSPTSTKVLDSFATQTRIHLEKTSFFSVSTHGVNQYTFLEYINMRLVMILQQDVDFSGTQDANGMGDSEATNRTIRTDRAGNAAYVQVTFTMGAQYQPNLDSGGLVPLDSVRAGRGTFFGGTNLDHVCDEYAAATDNGAIGLTSIAGLSGSKKRFNDTIAQPCGPQASMCVSPTSVPDQFVSFNIPLGFGVFDGQANNDLSNNIFVDFVVNALDTDPAVGGTAGPTPNQGDDPKQMKTTLTASIPIVAGGLNIFCDGITAKTDLKDVADVDIVVGTANSTEELTRLRILEDIASTDLNSVPSSQIDTDSIESALMTLVIKGNESYFSPVGRNTGDYTMELDDVITLHLMEDGDAGTVTNGVSTNSKETQVIALLNQPGDDNSDSNGLDTDGYALNGAFYFEVNRAGNTASLASLEPSTALLAQCPFNPPRPTGSTPLESCILRRDVKGRGYGPFRTGSQPTAMEILAAPVPKDSTEALVLAAATNLPDTSPESIFLAETLGDSAYTAGLAPDFVRAINERYALNGRYRRAYWINPGYEWTPTQTAGKSIFSVSQKIYLFALVSMDENWVRRRMLLQATSGSDPLAENAAGINAASLTFEVTPTSMFSKALDVPEDRVALFDVEMQLSQAEACMEPSDLQGVLRLGLKDMLTSTASSFLTVQVTALSIDRGAEQCSPARRNLRKLLADFSTATATIKMLVVFAPGSVSQFNMDEFAKQPGVNSIEADSRNSPKLKIVPVLDCTKVTCGEVPSGSDVSSDSSSSTDVALIGGIAGGVGGALVVGAGLFLFMRRKGEVTDAVSAVQTIDVTNLKAQLADEV